VSGVTDMAMRYVRAAARADGAAVLGAAGADGDDPAVAAARQLLGTVFGTSATGPSAPAELAELAAHPDDNEAENALYVRIDDILAADPVIENAVTAVLTVLYRRAFATGDTQAVTMDLFRNCGDRDAALAAYRQAADAGSADAVFALARLLERGFGDPDAARSVYQEAIDAGNPETCPQAPVQLGYLLARDGRDEPPRKQPSGRRLRPATVTGLSPEGKGWASSPSSKATMMPPPRSTGRSSSQATVNGVRTPPIAWAACSQLTAMQPARRPPTAGPSASVLAMRQLVHWAACSICWRRKTTSMRPAAFTTWLSRPATAMPPTPLLSSRICFGSAEIPRQSAPPSNKPQPPETILPATYSKTSQTGRSSERPRGVWLTLKLPSQSVWA